MESLKEVESDLKPSSSCEMQSNSLVPVMRKEKTIRCSSQLLTKKFTYTWKILEFDEIPFISNYPVYSPSFEIKKGSKTFWQIVMTKHMYYSHRNSDSDDNEEGDDSYSEDEDYQCEGPKIKHEKSKRIGLRLAKDIASEIWDTVSYSFTLKTSDGDTVITDQKDEPGIVQYQGINGVPLYFYITEKDFKNGNLFNEKYLEVTCNINYSYIEDDNLGAPVAYEGKQFVEDLKVLFVGHIFSDLLLTVNGNVQHSVHKLVLHAAAPGFGKLLEDQHDSHKTRFELKLDSEVGKAMVNFMYSGKIMDGFPLEKCPDLYDAAKLYGVDCLGQYCSNYFKDNLPSEVCKVCLGITDGVEDCLRYVKQIGIEKIKGVLSKEACSHKN